MKHFALLFLLLVLATGCANNKDNTSNTAANHDNNRQHKTRDESPAEIAPGRFRADTALVFYEGKYDPKSAFIVISKRELRLNVYATVQGDTTLIARYPVCLARQKGQKQRNGDMTTPQSPAGKPFVITQIVDASTWTHDFGDGRGAILSYGPWFMRLKTPFSGIGIHGSTGNANKMPGRDSEGCIRLRDADVAHLKQHYAQVGMTVEIKGEEQGRHPYENHAIKNKGKFINYSEPQ